MSKQLLTVLLLLLAGACRNAGPDVTETKHDAAERTVYLVGHGWHVGIALRRADVADAPWPALEDFPEANYLEVGWGDAAYYQDPDPSLGTTLRAGLWPTPSVLHVAGVAGSLERFFQRSEIIRVDVTDDGLRRLTSFIAAAHARRDAGGLIRLGPGLYGDSRFYAAADAYHVFNNCNHWIAQALQAAGVRIAPSLTAGGLLRQLRTLGEVVQAPAPS
jgi:uncharacterized protein (TIGR02117 family)